jgi:hypothetical protein
LPNRVLPHSTIWSPATVVDQFEASMTALIVSPLVLFIRKARPAS